MTGAPGSTSTRTSSGAGRGDPSPDRHRDERTEFLLQSLRDLEAEHAAGDIDDEDFTALRDDYTARAARALRAEERGRAPAVVDRSPRSWPQRVAVVVGLVAFAVVAGVLVAGALGDRRDGESITGEVTQTPTQAASECIGLTTSQQMADAIPCYEAVLSEDPDNAVAHTYLGWTLYLTAISAAGDLQQDVVAGLYSEARNQLDQAVESDPGYADARAFQIVIAKQEGRFGDAQAQLDAFDQLDAPADIQRLVNDIRQDITDGLAAEGGSDQGSGPGSSEPGDAPSTAPGDPSVPGPTEGP